MPINGVLDETPIRQSFSTSLGVHRKEVLNLHHLGVLRLAFIPHPSSCKPVLGVLTFIHPDSFGAWLLPYTRWNARMAASGNHSCSCRQLTHGLLEAWEESSTDDDFTYCANDVCYLSYYIIQTRANIHQLSIPLYTSPTTCRHLCKFPDLALFFKFVCLLCLIVHKHRYSYTRPEWFEKE